MPSLEDFFLITLNKVAHVIDRNTFYVKRKPDLPGPLMIQAYMGLADRDKIRLNSPLPHAVRHAAEQAWVDSECIEAVAAAVQRGQENNA